MPTIEDTVDLKVAPSCSAVSARRWPLGVSTTLVAVAGFIGLLAFTTLWRSLWTLWITDPLRSAGLLVPPVAVALGIRVRHAAAQRGDTRHWHGQAWGLALAIIAMGLGLLGRPQLQFSVDLFGHYAAVNVLTSGILLALYVSGVVILLAGYRGWRALAFPILLLILVNPLPGAFSKLLDLPLQHIGAATARSFAALIHVPVSTGTLKMMFSPHLGMFIAPGCDGLRGVVAMGLLALVLGHLYRLRPLRWLAFAIGALFLAYLLNLLRLCAVVIYYWFALRLPWLGQYGTQADYIIGGILFCLAVALLLGVSRWLSSRRAPAAPSTSPTATETAAHAAHVTPSSRRLSRGPAIAMGLFVPLAVVAAGTSLYANRDLWGVASSAGPALATLALLPPTFNGAMPVKRWTNPRPGGPIEQGALYHVAGQGEASEVQLDFYRNDTRAHRGIGCYMTQGESLVAEHLRTLMLASGPAIFDIGLLRSRNQLRLVATTECTAATCTEQRLHAGGPVGLRWIPGSGRFAGTPSVVPMSVMLRRHLPDDATASVVAKAKAELLAQLTHIAPQLDLAPAQKLAALETAARGIKP